MNTVFFTLLFPCLFCVVFLSCDGSIPRKSLLDEPWHHAAGTCSDTAADAPGYTWLPTGYRTHLEKLVPGGAGVLWVKKKFFSDPAAGSAMTLFMDEILPVDEAYINGHFTGASGLSPCRDGRFFSDWNSLRKYDFSGSILKKGENELLIKIYIYHEGRLPEFAALGEKGSFDRPYRLHTFFKTDINIGIALLILVFGLNQIQIFIRRPKNRETLYYACACFMFAVYQTNFFITQTPLMMQDHISYFWFQKIVFSAKLLTAYFMVKFLCQYLGVKRSKPADWTLHLLCLAPVAAILANPDYAFFMRYLRIITSGMLIPFILYAFVIIISTVSKKTRAGGVALAGMIPLSFCVFYDILTDTALFQHTHVYLSGIGFSAMLTLIMITLTNRFTRYQNELEEVKTHLDQKVEERTRDLHNANANIESAMKEMEEMNDKLIEVSYDLASAQRVIQNDMNMAASIQKSFFPKIPPAAEGWDIAFEFLPMAAVSGDLYDFYSYGSMLKGAVLLDISGHGIASGLITMIARSAFYRNFIIHGGKPLGEIMMCINDDLIGELWAVDNFVTGILLRFSGDRVEYVNAGHHDILHKKFGGEINPVITDLKAYKGHFLGIERLRAPYQSLTFQPGTGDTLLLFTDGIVESTNRNNEQYDINKLTESFRETDSGLSAQNQLDRIMEKFHSFIGNKKPTDDVTVILLKKTG